MSSRRHHSLARSRSRRRPRPVAISGTSCLLWLPPTDSAPIVVAEITDAIEIVFELFEMPMIEAALMMLDARRTLLGVLLDPPVGVEILAAWAKHGDVPVAFCQTIVVVVEPDIPDGPPTAMETIEFQALSRRSLDHGVLLLDMIFANPDKVRSMAFATDPNCVWTEPFDR